MISIVLRLAPAAAAAAAGRLQDSCSFSTWCLLRECEVGTSWQDLDEKHLPYTVCLFVAAGSTAAAGLQCCRAAELLFCFVLSV